MEEFLKKKYVVPIIIFIIMTGAFAVRFYNFRDWLHFELDQARDAQVVSQAIENGPAELPLLGPRAQGTYLRLGPAFYYLEYASAKVFGNTPPGIALGIAFFSLLAIPIIYLFFRRYFDRKISLVLLLLFGFSFFLVMYSRFAWNPNLLVFFIPFSLYALLRASDREEKKKGIWLVISFISLSISTQLHFLAFLILPVTFLLFLLMKRPMISARFWAAAFMLALILYLPVFINEYKTRGDNAKQFLKAIREKSEQNSGSVVKKLFFNIKEHSAGYFLLLSGRDGNSLLGIDLNGIANWSRACKKDCPNDYYLSLTSLAFLFSGFFLLWLKAKKETNTAKKDFIQLNSLWFLVNFAIFIPLSPDISPRFFLLSAFLPFVFLGLLFQTVPQKFKLNIIAPAAAVLILLYSNGIEIKNRFEELAAAPVKNLKMEIDPILKEKTRVTYAQEKLIAEYIGGSQSENSFPIFFASDPRYSPALAYILKERGIIFNDKLTFSQVYRNANYFSVNLTSAENEYKLGEKEKSRYDIIGAKNFGTLTVLKLSPKEETVTDESVDFGQAKKKVKSRTPKRYRWSEIFGDSKEIDPNELDED